MKRTIALYALALAVAAIALSWLEYKYVTRVFAGEIYIALIAIGFTGLGIWAGRRLTTKRAPSAEFELNHAALSSLGLTPRRLEISPNTVKTHVASVYEKLGVSRRTQAVQKAKELALIP